MTPSDWATWAKALLGKASDDSVSDADLRTALDAELFRVSAEWYGKVAFSEEQPILSCAPIVKHAKQCSGIWLEPDDLPRLAFMPGMVTDRYLRRV